MNTPPLSFLRRSFSLHPADLLFPGLTLFLILAARVGFGAKSPIVVALLVTGVVLAGLPHGSLDPLVARQVFGQDRGFTMIRFFFGYLLLAAATAAGWLAAPNVALSLFLIVSAFHFGSDWQGRGDGWGRAAYGFCVISISTLNYTADVRQIFSTLGATRSENIVSGLRLLAGVAILLATLSLFRRTQRRLLDCMELAGIVLGGLALPPLVFFTCYFCLLHSPRHLLLTSQHVGLRGPVQVVVAAAPIVVATLGLAALLWLFLPAYDASSRVLQVVFIGLAALTAPHMLLTALSERKRLHLTRKTPTLA